MDDLVPLYLVLFKVDFITNDFCFSGLSNLKGIRIDVKEIEEKGYENYFTFVKDAVRFIYMVIIFYSCHYVVVFVSSVKRVIIKAVYKVGSSLYLVNDGRVVAGPTYQLCSYYYHKNTRQQESIEQSRL